MSFNKLKNWFLYLCKAWRIQPKYKIKNAVKIYNPICQLVAFTNFFEFGNSFSGRKENRRYWTSNNIDDILSEADFLFEQEDYLKVYEILNRIQFYNYVEVQWRICRVLFKLQQNEEDTDVKENMILEAYTLINRAIVLEENNAEVQKWMAIILDQKTSMEGMKRKLQFAPKVKEHLLKSIQLNPNDPTTLYMLGKWCYDISKLTWLQKQLATFFFSEPPESTVTEAYQYFLKAEQQSPRFFIGNLYMLGLCCYEMNELYRARYYLTIAADLPPRCNVELEHKLQAQKLAERLKDYEVIFENLNE